jgi:hypothetical protein
MNQIREPDLHGGHEMGSLQDKLQQDVRDEQQDVPDELDEEIDRYDALDPRVGIAAVVVFAALVAGAGFVIIRRRRRRSLMKRLQDALPAANEVRATLKRQLRRAVKLL